MRMHLVSLAVASIGTGSCLAKSPPRAANADDSASVCALLAPLAAGVELEQNRGPVLLQACIDAVTLASDHKVRLQFRIFADRRFDSVVITVYTPSDSLKQIEPRGAIKGSQRPGYVFTDQILIDVGPLRTPIDWLKVAVKVCEGPTPLHADVFEMETALPIAWLNDATKAGRRQ